MPEMDEDGRAADYTDRHVLEIDETMDPARHCRGAAPRPPLSRPPAAPLATPWWSTPWGAKICDFVWRVGLGVWKVIIAGALTLLIVTGIWLLVAILTAHAEEITFSCKNNICVGRRLPDLSHAEVTFSCKNNICVGTRKPDASRIDDAIAAYNRRDYATALRLLRPLADEGNTDAQNTLAGMYHEGHGVPRNYTEAVKWLRKAADQGHAAAQNNLGLSYARGQGVTQNYTEAVKWLRKAADQGDADAQLNLGVMYENGKGVPQDYAEAVKWFRKAADQGNADAEKKRVELLERFPSLIEPSERITEDEKPVLAAARIFALKYVEHGAIGAADADEAHIGEDLEVNHAAGQKCTFTVRKRDGPLIGSISFDRLSNEYRTSRDSIGYYSFGVSGQPGAVCDYIHRKCWNGLNMTLTDDGVTLALRALQYIFSNVCKPVELPF